ncbi:Hyphally regulated cell wall protein 4 [Pseudocercospora fuligena]|uniref:Hyphally regulated cell wall protein 4 n=1 Tax=Pseudocercospora fuligena TaxID=685502 RepID=A0A8H6R7U4_9PEZI|nr:Hyphally regulated cell wall protein 4 [Pseudocercospora fuligena]
MSLSKFAVSAALLTLVQALPQKPDFNAIAAAPTVASGPSAFNGDADQIASLFTSFTVSGPTTAASTAAATAAAKRGLQARDTVISSDVTDSSYNGKFGTAGQLSTINPGVTYWINGGSTHNFFGNINNQGRLIVSQTRYLKQNRLAGGQTSDWVGHDANNGNLQNAAGALIQLNDYGSASAPTYDWYIRSMQNAGTIQWCGRGDTGGSTFQMYNDLTSRNTGLISFEQFFDNRGASFVWRNPTLTTTSTTGQNLYNDGAFRIINVVYHNVQNVYGSGCWQIGKGGILYLEDGTGVSQNPTAGPSFPGQSISFQDPTADLHMDTAVYSRNSNFGPQLYGFGQGNAIEFYQTISSFKYNAGVLNVAFVGGNTVNIKLGQGYDASKFANRRNPPKYNAAGYNAIFYDGAAPSQSAPSQCSISAPVCSDLSNGLPGGSSSSSVASSTASMTTSTRSSTVSNTASSTISSTISSTASRTTSSIPSSTVSNTISSTASSTQPTTTAPASTFPPTTPETCPNTPYTPYYPALATGYTTDPALTGTATSSAPGSCATQPEAGTYCGFINPLDPCAPQPDGYGPVPSPDTASAFLAFDQLHASASAAPTVIPSDDNTQYTQVFKDLNGATSAQSYLGLYTLKKYDAAECAAKCDCTELCTAFNIYAERDPSLNPTNNDSTYDPGYPTVWGQNCPNPPSQTAFKCTLWGFNIDVSTATNTGETRSQFQVVITASNGYDKTNVTVPPKPNPNPNPWKDPHNCGGKAIDAPSFWLGSRFFPGPFNPLVCGDYAGKQSATNKANGAADVKMFNAYYLHKNGKPHGTYCSLYNSVLGDSYASYTGENNGGDRYDCKQSWTYALNA